MLSSIKILAECDQCGKRWEQAEGKAIMCPNCWQTGHRYVSDVVMGRMAGLLDGRSVEASRLIRAFAACTVGGESFALTVLDRALSAGVLVTDHDLVERPDFRAPF